MNPVFRQFEEDVAGWVRRTFGEASLMDTQNRACRVVEEAVELAQAEGISSATLDKIIRRTYSRPVGDVVQEAAGTLFTLLAYGYASGIDIALACRAEIERVNALPPDTFRAKQTEKFLLGTDLVAPVGSDTTLSVSSTEATAFVSAETDTLKVVAVADNFREVLRITEGGAIFWNGREVSTDDELRTAMRELGETLKANLMAKVDMVNVREARVP